MNTEKIKKRLEEYYRTATPEQVVAEFEALGVVFDEVPQINMIEFSLGGTSGMVFNNDYKTWSDDFLVGLSESTVGVGLPAPPKNPPTQPSTQFAMAA